MKNILYKTTGKISKHGGSTVLNLERQVIDASGAVDNADYELVVKRGPYGVHVSFWIPGFQQKKE